MLKTTLPSSGSWTAKVDMVHSIMKFDHFLQHICPELGLNWRKYRRKGARRGVLNRMRDLKLSSFEEYIDHLRTHPEEGDRLPDIMHITVTRFYRDGECWEGLINILPNLIVHGKKPRVLSAGCCGGEEPYTIAILWKEVFEEDFGPIDILAVDMDEASLNRAQKAIYDKWSLRELPDAWCEKWFSPSKKRLRLSQQITSMVRFEQGHLFHAPPPGPFDLILCRYLFFTYFIDDLRFHAAHNWWQALRSGGALMIGKKEGLGPRELKLFTPCPEAPCMYRKTE